MSSVDTSDLFSGVYAPIKNGQVTGQAAPTDKATAEVEKANAKSSLDKDAFLTLLVTQMKYQDPLEPQDNSQMVSQLATFSSLEEMQNMAQTMDKQRASALIGQVVDIDHVEASGAISKLEGVVDFVSFQGSKTLVSVNGNLYPIEEVKSVVDPEYTVAVKLAEAFTNQLKKLPALENLTSDKMDEVKKIVEAYSSMDNYQRSMLSQETMKKYGEYAEWYVANMPKEEKAEES